MRLTEGRKGRRFLLKSIDGKTLAIRLLSLGLCNGDEFILENVANGNFLLKTLETKIVLSHNLAQKLDIEVIG
ncbi:ferrous iron transport protein A [Leptotrichia sp.]|jgi:feoA domain protein|uniref:FeoA family protein n=1 Tax=Leptotrichia sp. TaxID=104608 RepID=UPI00184D3853|nr:ferrous iron transport protein A [Leptotrichia sp.]MBB1534484.1 ferrous iron transport protein A [Leptotrichia sp.]